jgi:hypothetical protein
MRDRVIAHLPNTPLNDIPGAVFSGRSRLLCAYPEHAQHNRSGKPEGAANFTCKSVTG